jgi:hypothetical protein
MRVPTALSRCFPWLSERAWKGPSAIARDENHASGRSLGSLLLFTEAGVSADVALGPSRTSHEGADQTSAGGSFPTEAEALAWPT